MVQAVHLLPIGHANCTRGCFCEVFIGQATPAFKIMLQSYQVNLPRVGWGPCNSCAWLRCSMHCMKYQSEANQAQRHTVMVHSGNQHCSCWHQAAWQPVLLPSRPSLREPHIAAVACQPEASLHHEVMQSCPALEIFTGNQAHKGLIRCTAALDHLLPSGQT